MISSRGGQRRQSRRGPVPGGSVPPAQPRRLRCLHLFATSLTVDAPHPPTPHTDERHDNDGGGGELLDEIAAAAAVPASSQLQAALIHLARQRRARDARHLDVNKAHHPTTARYATLCHLKPTRRAPETPHRPRISWITILAPVAPT